MDREDQDEQIAELTNILNRIELQDQQRREDISRAREIISKLEVSSDTSPRTTDTTHQQQGSSESASSFFFGNRGASFPSFRTNRNKKAASDEAEQKHIIKHISLSFT